MVGFGEGGEGEVVFFQENVPNNFLKKVYTFFISVTFSLKCHFKEMDIFFIKVYTFFMNL